MTTIFGRIYGKLAWEMQKALAPRRAKQKVVQVQKVQDEEIHAYVRAGNPIKLIIGSGGTSYPGWLSSDVPTLDITNPDHWQKFFKPNSIERILAEHVLEHLTEEQNQAALALAYQYLKPGGMFRIAVPDGFRRDPAYVAEVTPPKDGHQMLFTINNLRPMMESAGFEVRPLEYFDASEEFHATEWDAAEGHIMRSVRFDHQTDFQRDNLFYTSLIVDGLK